MKRGNISQLDTVGLKRHLSILWKYCIGSQFREGQSYRVSFIYSMKYLVINDSGKEIQLSAAVKPRSCRLQNERWYPELAILVRMNDIIDFVCSP